MVTLWSAAHWIVAKYGGVACLPLHDCRAMTRTSVLAGQLPARTGYLWTDVSGRLFANATCHLLLSVMFATLAYHCFNGRHICF